MKQVKVTLVKSLIAAKPNQKATAKSLGLNKIGDVAIHNEGEVINGKLAVIGHLVKTENI